MTSIAIKAENLSKSYLVGQISHGTLIRDFESWMAKVKKKVNPYQQVDQAKHVSSNSKIWALKNVNFEIPMGEIIAITGDNGAGKSTLLKILSRVTLPTSGKVTVKGRINSLLEIGAGFHPELTGYQNIYLNGAMLGMRRSQIEQNFEEIVHFAAIGEHLQTPVKRYSSGMYMRLAFSIAVHLKSEIMIMDEILAVGDSSFQNNCMSKIKSLSEKEGRTIIMVSHDAQKIKFLCNKEIALRNGQIDKPW